MTGVVVVDDGLVGRFVVTTVRKELVDNVDTSHDRSSTNCDTPLVTRLDNKSVVLIWMEQTSDQKSMATQLDIDMHNSMQSATDDNG